MAKKIILTDQKINDWQPVIGSEFVGKFVSVDEDGNYIFDADGKKFRVPQHDSIDKALKSIDMSTEILMYLTPIEEGYEVAIEEDDTQPNG